MKKLMSLALAFIMVLSMAACSKPAETQASSTAAPTAAPSTAAPSTAAPSTVAPTEPAAKSENDIWTWAEFWAAEEGTKLTVVTTIQDRESWWDNKATFYTQSEEGAFFLYDFPCSQEEFDKLIPGTTIQVTGTKSIYSGMVELTDTSYEILGSADLAAAADVTEKVGTDEYVKTIGLYAKYSEATIVASKDGEGKEVAWMYKWNGSGAEGDDVYFSAEVNGQTLVFNVRKYLRGADTDVYKAAKELKVGDTVDLTGFVYWYEDASQSRITEITLRKAAADVKTWAEFWAAEEGTKLTVETTIQDRESWWDNKATFYSQNADGAFFLYDMPCSEEDFAKLVPGTRIRVTGTKSIYSGMVELTDTSYEILGSADLAAAADVTEKVGTDEYVKTIGLYAKYSKATIVASKDGEGKEVAWMYKWNGSGAEGDDVYFSAEVNGQTLVFNVRKYLRSADTDVYKAAKELKVGDTVDLTGFVYWYEDASQSRITGIAK